MSPLVARFGSSAGHYDDSGTERLVAFAVE